MLNYAQFLSRYPEFTTSDAALLQSALAEAALSIDPTVYGTRADSAHGALTAHLIFISPAGLSLRTDSDNADSSDYLKRFQRIRREVAPKFALTR